MEKIRKVGLSQLELHLLFDLTKKLSICHDYQEPQFFKVFYPLDHQIKP